MPLLCPQRKTEFLHARQLPGQSSGASASGQDRDFSSVMAIAAHPGDAFFAMGAPVAVATHSGGQGFLLSLSLERKVLRQFPPNNMDRRSGKHRKKLPR